MKRVILALVVLAVVGFGTANGSPIYFLETFDSDPVLSASQAPGVWYTDRYAPSVFESEFFDGDNRLHVGISEADLQSQFYNTQGRKFDLDNPVGTFLTADLYIGADWETEDRRAGLWATAFDASNTISKYPIIGFISESGAAAVGSVGSPFGFRVWIPSSGWQMVGLPAGFAYDDWYTLQIHLTASSFEYYINGNQVVTDVTNGSTYFGNMMLQAFNFGANYDVYWDNVGANSDTNPVPEPSTVLLLATGLVGVVAYRRRQKVRSIDPLA